VRALCR